MQPVAQSVCARVRVVEGAGRGSGNGWGPHTQLHTPPSLPSPRRASGWVGCLERDLHCQPPSVIGLESPLGLLSIQHNTCNPCAQPRHASPLINNNTTPLCLVV